MDISNEDEFIERIADVVVRRIEDQRKIELIVQMVLKELERRGKQQTKVQVRVESDTNEQVAEQAISLRADDTNVRC